MSAGAAEPRVRGRQCVVCCWREVEVRLAVCGHQFCSPCLTHACCLSLEQGRVPLQCLQCSEHVSPHNLASLLPDPKFQRYLDLCLRRYLASAGGVRYCPAPDCPYACLWSWDGRSSSACQDSLFQCRHLTCGRQFCYSCRRPWHGQLACAEARAREEEEEEVRLSLPESSLSQSTLQGLNVKQCPQCGAAIEKVRDDSCNLVSCGHCESSFCWLCGRKASEMHFFSPTGCGMYGQQQWSQHRLWCCRALLWLLALPLVLLLALLTTPVMLVAFPATLAYLTYTSKLCSGQSRGIRVCCVVCVVLLCAALDLLVGMLWLLLFPLVALTYIYIVIPVHLMATRNCCRNNRSQ